MKVEGGRTLLKMLSVNYLGYGQINCQTSFVKWHNKINRIKILNFRLRGTKLKEKVATKTTLPVP